MTVTSIVSLSAPSLFVATMSNEYEPMSAFAGAGFEDDAESRPVSESNSRNSGSVPEIVRAGVGCPVAIAAAPGKVSPTSSVNTVCGVTVRTGVAGG